MHRIDCPWCGVRDEAEFQYQGDATKPRPADDAGEDPFYDYVYTRTNPKGWHVEWWHHVGGCRLFVKVLRNTLTHQIAATGLRADDFGRLIGEAPAAEARIAPANAPKASPKVSKA